MLKTEIKELAANWTDLYGYRNNVHVYLLPYTGEYQLSHNRKKGQDFSTLRKNVKYVLTPEETFDRMFDEWTEMTKWHLDSDEFAEIYYRRDCAFSRDRIRG